MSFLVIDVETQKTFQEVGGKSQTQRLGVSVAGVYDYADDAFKTYVEDELPALESLIKSRQGVIGFNIKSFDWAVLQPYFKTVNTLDVPTIDIMVDLEVALGYRVSLENVAQGTLGEGKSGHGLEAIRLWREGKFDELKKYCLDDVRITRDIYNYGREKGEVWFEAGWEKYPVEVKWK